MNITYSRYTGARRAAPATKVRADAEAALLGAGEYVRCSAVSIDGTGDVRVWFRNREGAEVVAEITKDAYRSQPLGEPKTPAAYGIEPDNLVPAEEYADIPPWAPRMTEITITPVAEASIGPARHPIYCQYQGQSRPQAAFIALDCRDGSVWADYNAEIGNAVPVDVWHGHILRFGISPYASGARINAEMEALRPRFAEIVDGYSWDGSNTRARWTDEAVRAIDIAERETLEYPEDPCDGECAICWPEES